MTSSIAATTVSGALLRICVTGTSGAAKLRAVVWVVDID
jgi:hypothetical protein